MPRLVRKLSSLFLLSALLILQVHVLFEKHNACAPPDDDCALCAQVLTTVATTPVSLPKLQVALLPFAFKAPVQPKAAFVENAAFPALRGPPASPLA